MLLCECRYDGGYLAHFADIILVAIAKDSHVERCDWSQIDAAMDRSNRKVRSSTCNVLGRTPLNAGTLCPANDS